MMSPSLSPCDSASRGLTQAVGSHVIFVSGFGSSCSQPLFAKRPSHTVGSGLKMISRPDPEGLPAAGCPLPADGGWPAGGVATVALEAGNGELEAEAAAPAAVPGIHPSCNTCFQNLSALPNGWPSLSVIVQPPTWPP